MRARPPRGSAARRTPARRADLGSPARRCSPRSRWRRRTPSWARSRGRSARRAGSARPSPPGGSSCCSRWRLAGPGRRGGTGIPAQHPPRRAAGPRGAFTCFRKWGPVSFAGCAQSTLPTPCPYLSPRGAQGWGGPGGDRVRPGGPEGRRRGAGSRGLGRGVTHCSSSRPRRPHSPRTGCSGWSSRRRCRPGSGTRPRRRPSLQQRPPEPSARGLPVRARPPGPERLPGATRPCPEPESRGAQLSRGRVGRVCAWPGSHSLLQGTSSEPSPQSSAPLHHSMLDTQRPLLHWRKVFLQRRVSAGGSRPR